MTSNLNETSPRAILASELSDQEKIQRLLAYSAAAQESMAARLDTLSRAQLLGEPRLARRVALGVLLGHLTFSGVLLLVQIGLLAANVSIWDLLYYFDPTPRAGQIEYRQRERERQSGY